MAYGLSLMHSLGYQYRGAGDVVLLGVVVELAPGTVVLGADVAGEVASRGAAATYGVDEYDAGEVGYVVVPPGR